MKPDTIAVRNLNNINEIVLFPDEKSAVEWVYCYGDETADYDFHLLVPLPTPKAKDEAGFLAELKQSSAAIDIWEP